MKAKLFYGAKFRTAVESVCCPKKHTLPKQRENTSHSKRNVLGSIPNSFTTDLAVFLSIFWVSRSVVRCADFICYRFFRGTYRGAKACPMLPVPTWSPFFRSCNMGLWKFRREAKTCPIPQCMRGPSNQ